MNKLYVSLGLVLLITSIAIHTALVRSNGQVSVLLVVDDDGAKPSETVEKENGEILSVPDEMSVDVTPYHDAFSQPAMSGYTLTEWHTSTSGSPSLTDLQNYDVVIWATGNEYVAINNAEAQTLADYYNNGYGDLILEGGEIFWDHQCDVGDPLACAVGVYDWDHDSTSYDNQLLAWDPSHPLFNTPNTMTFPITGTWNDQYTKGDGFNLVTTDPNAHGIAYWGGGSPSSDKGPDLAISVHENPTYGNRAVCVGAAISGTWDDPVPFIINMLYWVEPVQPPGPVPEMPISMVTVAVGVLLILVSLKVH